ncbi:MAG: hypothetical protein AAGA18_04765 [Verrucomicrobiota bacterium]
MASPSSKEKIRKSRDGAVTLEIDLEEGDEFVSFIGRENGLYYITRNKILRYRSPDDIDPNLEHENVPWTQNLILPHGASDPIVARTIIQTENLVQNFFIKGTKKHAEISDISWEVMNSLVSLRFIKQRLKQQVENHVRTIEENLEEYTRPDKPKTLPIIDHFNIEFRSFVNEVKRGLQTISKLFLPLTNKDDFKNAKFHKAQLWAEKEKGKDSLLAQMLAGDQVWVKTWIDIRNTLEHPKKDEFVETLDFSLEPDGTIRLPTWRFVHPDYDMGRPQNLLDVMNTCIDNLLKFYEDLLIALLDGHLPSHIKVFFEVIPEENRDPKLPLRYHFSSGVLNNKGKA